MTLSARLYLKIEPRLDELKRLVAAVEDLGRRDDWPPDLAFQVNLVLEEIVINVINHGGNDGLREIEVILTSEPTVLTIEITDDGKPFDPLKDAPVPNLAAPLEERPVGGLGIHLVLVTMDEVRYEQDEGRNRLTLAKHRDP